MVFKKVACADTVSVFAGFQMSVTVSVLLKMIKSRIAHSIFLTHSMCDGL